MGRVTRPPADSAGSRQQELVIAVAWGVRLLLLPSLPPFPPLPSCLSTAYLPPPPCLHAPRHQDGGLQPPPDVLHDWAKLERICRLSPKLTTFCVAEPPQFVSSIESACLRAGR